MDLDQFLTYCHAKAGVEETFPFNETTLVMKVMGKMFALTALDRLPFQINLKCDPDRALELRGQYAEITAGYHMSKTHWNTINCEGEVPDALIRALIDHSYDLVVGKLTKKAKASLADLQKK